MSRFPSWSTTPPLKVAPMMQFPALRLTLAACAVILIVQEAPACRCRCGYVTASPCTSGAVIVVQVSASAELFFDDERTISTGPTRVFTTPPLEPGKDFTYTVKVVIN